ncbi:UNVERIFIED_CONTAM: hypothetical protein FKN15_018250 [Acipenser sinensis]
MADPYAALGALAQALALAPAQLITPAPELTSAAPVVAPDVTEPDFSIAEEDHDAILVASWEGGSFLQKQLLPPPDHSFGPVVEELLQCSHQECKASWQGTRVTNE